MEYIMVSACLLGVNCKYNGKNNYHEELIEYLKDKAVIPICPEIYGGLPTPRVPSEILGKKVLNKEGLDVTDNFRRGAEESLKLAKKFNVKKAILKAKSPSCGFGNIYDGTFSDHLIPGNGITAELFKQNGIEILTENNFIK